MYELKLESGEQIVLAVRKHWLVYIGMAIPFAILAWLPLFMLEVAANYATTVTLFVDTLSTEDPWAKFVLGIWWLILWMGFFSAFSRNYLDIWILTNKRIVMIEQHGFFRREVMNLMLDHVRDVRTDVHGFFETLFGYGTIDVDSSGPDQDHFKMIWAYRPLHIRDAVMKKITALQEQGHLKKE